MPNRKLLKITSLCLVIFFCRFAQPVPLLDTGYTYPIGVEHRLPDLKCAYWFSGLTHMRLTRILLGIHGPNIATLSKISKNNFDMKAQLASLYNIGERIGALWLIYLYTSILQQFLENPSTDTYYAPENIISTHEYIMEKLELEIADRCRDGNRFDWRVTTFPQDMLGEENVVMQKLRENKFSMKTMVLKNQDNGLILFNNMNRFDLKRIFLFCTKGKIEVIQYFMIAFRSAEISWGNPENWFVNIQTNAYTLLWAYNDLVPIKTYITTTVNLFKVIMFRLTWKLLVFFEFEKASDVPGFVEQWLIIIQDFVTALAISEDVQIKFLLEAFRHHDVAKQECNAELIGYLQTSIILIADKIDCDATNKFNTSDLDSGIINPVFITWVLNACIKQGMKVIKTIEHTFEGSHFDVSWLLIDYIDDLNKYKLF